MKRLCFKISQIALGAILLVQCHSHGPSHNNDESVKRISSLSGAQGISKKHQNLVLEKSHFNNHISSIKGLKNGTYWALTHWQEIDDLRLSSSLQKRNLNDSSVLLNITLPKLRKDEAIKDFLVHENDEITAVIYYSDEIIPPYTSNAYLARFTKLGLVKYFKFLDPSSSYASYNNFAIQEIPNSKDFAMLTFNGPLRGYTLSRINSHFKEIWRLELDTNLYSFYASAYLLVDESTIYAVIESEESRMTNSKNKEIVRIPLYDNPTVDSIQKFYSLDKSTSMFEWAMDEENIYLSYLDDNKKMHFIALNKKSHSILWNKTYAFNPLEHINTIVPINRKILALGGKCNYDQAHTGSILKHSDAMLILLNARTGELLPSKTGKIENPYIFGTARADGIDSILPIGQTTLLVSGNEQGPITHEGESDHRLNYTYGFIHLLHF